MPSGRSANFPGPSAHVIALLAPAFLVFALVFGLGWFSLVALVAWIVLFVVIGLILGMVLFEHCPKGLFGAADTVVVTGTASLLSALVVAGFLGA